MANDIRATGRMLVPVVPSKDQHRQMSPRSRVLNSLGGDAPLLDSRGSVTVVLNLRDLLSRDCQGAVAMVNPQKLLSTRMEASITTRGQDGDPKEALGALKGKPLPHLGPADPHAVLAAIHDGGHGKPDPRRQHAL